MIQEGAGNELGGNDDRQHRYQPQTCGAVTDGSDDHQAQGAGGQRIPGHSLPGSQVSAPAQQHGQADQQPPAAIGDEHTFQRADLFVH